MRIDKITSLSNPKIKEVVALEGSSRLRTERGLFVVEGVREVSRCIKAGYSLFSIFYCPEIISLDEIPLEGDPNIFELSAACYDKIAYRGGTEGVVALVKMGEILALDSLDLGESPLVVVLESVEKPGNLGAVLRSADACGVDAVIVCDPRTDLYNPNLIRASLGGIFSLKVVAATSAEAIAWLKKSKINIYTAQLQDSKVYYDADFCAPTAIVLGTEADGLSMQWREASDKKILIPMNGIVDSLNVSVSMAVLCYEALRQRSCKKQ